LQNRLYLKIVQDNALAVQVWSNIYDPGYLLYTIPLGRLQSNEMNLNAGRFALYKNDPQEFKVIASFDHMLVEWFEERVGWIDQNAKGFWSFNVASPHVGLGAFEWSFADLNDALMFKLTF
jgi:hypothetical protein